jgi:hypothetical protein
MMTVAVVGDEAKRHSRGSERSKENTYINVVERSERSVCSGLPTYPHVLTHRGKRRYLNTTHKCTIIE